MEITTIPERSIPRRRRPRAQRLHARPSTADQEALPVLLYIHGGGYVAGTPASPWYDGAAFNRHGVVTVTVSYRLGFEGFGWLPEAPASRGVLDWLLALRWVREKHQAHPGWVTVRAVLVSHVTSDRCRS